jgi:hypothetical protein
MQQRTGTSQKKNSSLHSETVESLKSTPAGMAQTRMEALLGAAQSERETQAEHKTENFQRKVEFQRLYDAREQQEKRTVQELLSKINDEIKSLQRANSILTEEVKDIEKLTLSSADEQSGVYHIRFLELVLSFLKTLRAKVAESSTWLEALQSKKKKRGSLYSSLSKKKGTQYSLSEEHKVTRSTQ